MQRIVFIHIIIYYLQGFVRIFIRCDQATDRIVLHSKNLNIDSKKLTFRGNVTDASDPTFDRTTHEKARDFLTIHLNKNMVVCIFYNDKGRRFIILFLFFGREGRGGGVGMWVGVKISQPLLYDINWNNKNV